MGAIPVSDFKIKSHYTDFNFDAVTPIQYALDKVSVKGTFEHLYQAQMDKFAHEQGRALTQDLAVSLPVLLKHGIGIDTVKSLATLSMQERYFAGKNVGKQIHQKFNEFISTHCPSIIDNQQWALTLERSFNSLEVILEPTFFTLTMEPIHSIYHHPRYSDISKFLLCLSDRLGGKNEHDLLMEAEWELEECIELKNEKAFIKHYSEIFEFYESLEPTDDVTDVFNDKWGKIICLVNECRPELLEIQLACLLQPSQTVRSLDTILDSFTQDEIDSDPILTQLKEDIMWLQQLTPRETIHSNNADDHIGNRLFMFSEQVEDLQPDYIGFYEDSVNDAWNNGGSFHLTVDVENPKWLQDLRLFDELWQLMCRYFQCDYAS